MENTTSPAAVREGKTFEEWAIELRADAPAWAVNAARVKHHIPSGREMTEAAFRRFLKDVTDVTLGHNPDAPKPDDEPTAS